MRTIVQFDTQNLSKSVSALQRDGANDRRSLRISLNERIFRLPASRFESPGSVLNRASVGFPTPFRRAVRDAAVTPGRVHAIVRVFDIDVPHPVLPSLMQKKRVLTGITTTGTPHLGNFVGAIRPAIAASRRDDAESFFFLADYHALVKCDDPARIQRSTLEIAASWLACGLDPERVTFYRQSDIAEIPELTWFLTCVTAKGLLNRAHAYKASVDLNASKNEDADAGITAGLYMYPVLMAADILMFNASDVPVGRDQVQHIEIARDIAQRFNHIYGDDFFVLPEARVEDNVATLPGTDGRKMSKSYNNTIPLWLPAADLRRAVLGIVTDSRAPGESKDAESSNLFAIYQAFAGGDETAAMRRAFADGIAWGDAKQKVYERIDAEIAPLRERYDALIAKPADIEARLVEGAAKARARSAPFIERLRHAVGIRRLTEGASKPAAKSGEARDAAPSPKLVSYREKADGQFYFKLTAANGSTLMQSRPFASPKDAGLLSAALVEASDAPADFDRLLADTNGGTNAESRDAVREAFARIKADKAAKEAAA
jgi:tryptophanyl-tRNA synthetase